MFKFRTGVCDSRTALATLLRAAGHPRHKDDPPWCYLFFLRTASLTVVLERLRPWAAVMNRPVIALRCLRVVPARLPVLDISHLFHSSDSGLLPEK